VPLISQSIIDKVEGGIANRIAFLGADDVVVGLTEGFAPKDFGGLYALIANSG
jgi:hypothetical protein